MDIMFENDRCCAENTATTMNATANFDSSMGSMNMEWNGYMGGMPNACCQMPTCAPTMCPPIYECPQERVCHRTINYEVPHMIPCHTKMINHHVYHHSYTPCYSYSEQDEVTNVYGNRCC